MIISLEEAFALLKRSLLFSRSQVKGPFRDMLRGIEDPAVRWTMSQFLV
jgi:hypothetical protein